MSPAFALFTFVNAWWVTLFFVLPFYFRQAKNRTAIEYAAAPQSVAWKRVFLVNSLLSLAVTVVIALIIYSGLVPVHDMATY